MSSSEQSDWQLVEKDSLAKIEPPRRPGVPVGMTRKELIVVHLTATTVASCGMHFEQELMRSVSSTHPEFESLFRFLNPTDSRRGFFDEVTLVYTRSLPPPSQYTISTATVLEVFFIALRIYLDHEDRKEEEEEGKKMDFPYLIETDWSSKPMQWRHSATLGPPWCSVNDMKFAVGGLEAYRDCEWYDWAVSKRKEYNDYLLLRKTEYNRQFPAEEPIPMSLGFGESALIPQDQGLSTINVGAGETVGTRF